MGWKRSVFTVGLVTAALLPALPGLAAGRGKPVRIKVKAWEANPGQTGVANGGTITFCPDTPPYYLYAKGTIRGGKAGTVISVTTKLNGKRFAGNQLTLNKPGDGKKSIIDSIQGNFTAGTYVTTWKTGHKTVGTGTIKLATDVRLCESR